jgi:ATP-dependent DNA ligase
VVAGYRPHKTEPEAIGSLLLGLYDDPDNSVLPAAYREYSGGTNLSSVGVIGAFPMARRKELFVELQPLVTDFASHPWNWAAAFENVAESRSANRREASRWNPEKDLSFMPLRPERVVEVRYDHLEGHRFRHTAQFVRWRPDRDPASCGYDQLDQPVRFDVADVLAGRIAPEA